jgi:starvation-inducible outer membrane lipoprotein
LLNKYGLPEYSIENAGKKWKYVKVNGYPVWEIKMEVEVNAKKIELEVWWRYDENGKLDYTIYTFYPAK